MARLFAVLTILALSGSAFAQDQPAESSEDEAVDDEAVVEPEPSEPAANEVEARTRFTLGQQLYEQGRFEEALEQFRAAHELSGRPGLLYNIYLCHRDAGNNQEAATSLRAFLEAQPEVANRAMLERRLATLEEQLQREQDATRRADEAEQRAASVGPVERNFTGPLVTLSSGLAVLLAGGSLGLANRGLHDDITGRCYNGEICLSEEESEIDALDRRNLTADVLVGVGGAATLAGLIWLVVEGTRSAPNADTATFSCGMGNCEVRGTF